MSDLKETCVDFSENNKFNIQQLTRLREDSLQKSKK